jgi:hypothetical protein
VAAEKSDVLTFLFWSNFAFFVVHLIDEALMVGGFVPFIQRHFWSGFAARDFFDANAIWLLLIGISNILYDVLGRKAAVIPMAFIWERAYNALFHIGSTLYFKEYSPGLVSGMVFFVILYLVCRYGLLRKKVSAVAFFISGAVALVFELVFLSSMWWAH